MGIIALGARRLGAPRCGLRAAPDLGDRGGGARHGWPARMQVGGESSRPSARASRRSTRHRGSRRRRPARRSCGQRPTSASGLDDPHDLRLGARRGRDPRVLGRPLGRRRETSSSPDPHAAAAALVGAFMEYVTRLPGGHVIVFLLAVLILRLGVRRPAPGTAPARARLRSQCRPPRSERTPPSQHARPNVSCPRGPAACDARTPSRGTIHHQTKAISTSAAAHPAACSPGSGDSENTKIVTGSVGGHCVTSDRRSGSRRSRT